MSWNAVGCLALFGALLVWTGGTLWYLLRWQESLMTPDPEQETP